MPQQQHRALAMFAKAPRPGEVKTRLVPPLTMRQAASLARCFLEDSSSSLVHTARSADAVPFVFYDPPDAGTAVGALLAHGIRALAQSGGTLGDRLSAAHRELAAARFCKVCFLGSDSPTLPPAYVTSAFEALDGESDIVLGPAADGGFYLVGLRAAHTGLFGGVAWSTDGVFAQTRARAVALGLGLTVLPPWYDVDDAASLARLRAELLDPSSDVIRGNDAPRTRALLSTFS